MHCHSYKFEIFCLSLCVSVYVSLRDSQRMGSRTNAPPAWTRVRLTSNGQPRFVRTPPVLPAADHAGFPVWSRSALHELCISISVCFFFFSSESKPRETAMLRASQSAVKERTETSAVSSVTAHYCFYLKLMHLCAPNRHPVCSHDVVLI